MIRLSSRPLSIANGRRFLSANFPVRISDEIQQALAEKKPVVALESTIITHGMPFPANLEMALKVEQEIRASGAIPATIALVKGVPCVGLQCQEVEYLANSQKVSKVSRRDLAYTTSHGLNGGTTISGTMILSEKAGIKVFATGGLGGVHRDGHITMDVSADLDELGRTPVAVVCAGPKSILDIERTMEYLETKGCFVGTHGPPGTNIPGFFCRDSKVASPYNFQTFKEAAEIIHSGNSIGMNSGYLFCIPAPEEIAMNSDFIEAIIEKAIIVAAQSGIKGKYLTPFLLKVIADATGGASVSSNIGFVLNNARAGAQIANELSLLENSASMLQPSMITQSQNIQNKASTKLNISSPENTIDNISQKEVARPSILYDTAVVGSIALDSSCSLSTNNMGDSSPGKISSSIGGVGHNVALASTYSGYRDGKRKHSTKLISAVGNDTAGLSIIKSLKESGELDTDGILVSKDSSTAQYISMHTIDGELMVACADMSIIEKIPDSHISKQLELAKPKWCVFDANLSTESMKTIINVARKLDIGLIYEPTSVVKSTRLSNVEKLSVYPNNAIELITPTVNELLAIYDSFKLKEKFDVDHWFPVMDNLGLDSNFRNKLDAIALKSPFMKSALNIGIPQQAFQLLPFFPNILIKDGKNGILSISLNSNIKRASKDIKAPDYETLADFTLISKGTTFDESTTLGVIVEHYPIPQDIAVKNVTGAGDSFVGFILQQLSQTDAELSGVGLEKSLMISNAQCAAALSLQTDQPISEDIKYLN